jgi:outer membrane protein TolC
VAWVAYDLAKERKLNEEERLTAAEKTLETYLEQYEGGQQSLLDIMAVTNSRFLAQQDYYNVLYEEMNAVFNLKAVIGLPTYQTEMAISHEDKG